MRRYLRLAVCGFAATAILACTSRDCLAQSADTIIAQSLRASGGAKAIAEIRSASWQGTIEGVNGAGGGEFTLVTAAPGEFYREFTFGPQQIAEACNASSCWGQEGNGNLYTLFGAEGRREEATGRYLNFALANYKKLKIIARFAGADTVNGRPADVIELKIPPGETRRVYFDRQSHFIVKEIVEAAEEPSTQEAETGSSAISVFKVANAASMGGEEEVTYADYRVVQGVMEPFQISMKQGGQTFHISVDRIAFNGTVNPSSFTFPNLSKTPLPDIPALLTAIDQNQKKIDEIQKDYACMKREEEDKVDGKGEVTKRTLTVYQISYVAGHEMDRKIEVDGKALSAAEQQKEDERLQKEAEKYTREATEPQKKDNDDVTISDFLRTSRFTNPRWERFRGQDVVVFDFGPNPDYKPKRLVEKLIYDLFGTVWVDPQVQDIARLEARFGNSVKIGGGVVASLQKGSAFQFEQSLVNNQVWLPSYDEVHVGAKVFMVKNLREDVVDHYYDYQKFDVKTQQKIAPPKQP